MKKKYLFCFFCLIIIIFPFFVSCSTEPEEVKETVVEENHSLPLPSEVSEQDPPPYVPLTNTEPFTNALLIDLDYVMPPFMLSGEMSLQRNSSKEEVSLENGTVIIQEVKDGNYLKFEKNAEGKALRMEPNNEEILIYVGFIKEDGTQDDNALIFSSDKFDPNGLFYLKTYNKPDAAFSAEEKKSVRYGDQEYIIQYEGEIPPYLLVPVLRSNDAEQEEATLFPSGR
jgi:hypothetical protein